MLILSLTLSLFLAVIFSLLLCVSFFFSQFRDDPLRVAFHFLLRPLSVRSSENRRVVSRLGFIIHSAGIFYSFSLCFTILPLARMLHFCT